MIFVDDYSTYCFVYFMKRKDEVLDCFEKIYKFAFQVTGNRVCKLRSNNGSEYLMHFKVFLMSKEFNMIPQHHTILNKMPLQSKIIALLLKEHAVCYMQEMCCYVSG